MLAVNSQARQLQSYLPTSGVVEHSKDEQDVAIVKVCRRDRWSVAVSMRVSVDCPKTLSLYQCASTFSWQRTKIPNFQSSKLAIYQQN